MRLPALLRSDVPRSQELTRLGLGAIMVTAGTGHLSFSRKQFQAQVPDWFPMDKDVVVLASGVVEVAFGAAMLTLPQRRAAVGVALAAFYAATVPGRGFTVTGRGGDSLTFTGGGWDGAFTAAPTLSGLTLRRQSGAG